MYIFICKFKNKTKYVQKYQGLINFFFLKNTIIFKKLPYMLANLLFPKIAK